MKRFGPMIVVLVLAAAVFAEEGAKTMSIKGDVGAVTLDKDYIIVVTPDGKLHTMNFGDGTKVTELKGKKSTIAKIRPGYAVTITYTENGGKKIIQSVQYEATRGRRR